MTAGIVARVREFLVADCDALAGFYDAADNCAESGVWKALSDNCADMPDEWVEQHAADLAQLLELAARRVATRGEA